MDRCIAHFLREHLPGEKTGLKTYRVLIEPRRALLRPTNAPTAERFWRKENRVVSQEQDAKDAEFLQALACPGIYEASSKVIPPLRPKDHSSIQAFSLCSIFS